MKRIQIASFVFLSFVVGIVATIFLPDAAIFLLIFVPFFACIVLGWVLTIQNRGLNLSLIGLVFPVKPFVKVESSRALIAFGFCAANAIGGLIGLLLRTTHVR